MDMEVMVFIALEKSGKNFACGTSYLPHSKPTPWIVSHTFSEKGFRRSFSTELLTRMSKWPPFTHSSTRRAKRFIAPYGFCPFKNHGAGPGSRRKEVGTNSRRTAILAYRWVLGGGAKGIIKSSFQEERWRTMERGGEHHALLAG